MRILNPRFPKEKKAEIISTYLTGDNSYEELSDYYKVSAATIRGWVSRYRKRKKSCIFAAGIQTCRRYGT